MQVYENKVDIESKTKATAINETRDDFNHVLQMVFPDYKIKAEWTIDNTIKQGRLELSIQKFDLEPLNHEQLSTGERELLALIFSIYSSKNYEDIILLDEPEIHLNWSLEKGLFIFLDWFCEEFSKQIIVVTHSRIIFDSKFLNKVQYFVWRNKKIKVENSLPDEEKSQIAGEAIQALSVLLSPTIKTFIVEDEAHESTLSALAKILSKELQVIQANGKPNVEMFYKICKKQNQQNYYFLIDGDNQGLKYQDKNFIQLKKYCIQNYFINIEILSSLSNKGINDVKTAILNSLNKLKNSNNYLAYKKLSQICNIHNFPFEVLDTLDASEIIENLFIELGLNKKFDVVVPLYINKCLELKKLDNLFSEITIKL